MLLARLGVDHLLVSARPRTSDLPKAHVLNQRAMEVLEDVGVAEAVAERSTPPEQMAATAFYAGLAGPGPDYGRRLARLECWGAGGTDDSWRAASPWRQLNLPQIRLEPLLKARAEELSPGRIRFGHELAGLEQDGQGVQATVRDNASGRCYAVRCQYLLGADGGRRVPCLAGIGYEGLGVITQTATLHVSADFSAWAGDPDVLNVEYGYSYQSAAVVPDGSAPPAPADEIRVYQPSTRPGAPLPHAWIEDEDGNRRPVKDLVAPGRFLLIAGEDGQAWCEAARAACRAGEPPARRAADRPPRRRLPRPAVRLAAPPADRQRRRGPRAPGPVHRLAAPGRRQRSPRRPHCRAQPGPRPAGRRAGRVSRLRPPFPSPGPPVPRR
jgi:hypothetical protein